MKCGCGETANAADLKSADFGLVGSNPTTRTKLNCIDDMGNNKRYIIRGLNNLPSIQSPKIILIDYNHTISMTKHLSKRWKNYGGRNLGKFK